MTSTHKATPLHAFVLATVLVISGGVMRLNQGMPAAEYLAGAVYRILPGEAPQARSPSAEGTAATAASEKPETVAQRRARYASYIQAAAQASSVPTALIEAIITAESAFNPLAVSSTGAVGLMQLMPETAARFGVTDRTDPEQNILGGAKYLDFLLGKFSNPKLAIAAYNAGEGNVLKHGNKIPPFAETQKYVPRVLAFYTKYRREA